MNAAAATAAYLVCANIWVATGYITGDWICYAFAVVWGVMTIGAMIEAVRGEP